MEYNFTRNDMIKSFSTYVCNTCANVEGSQNFINFNDRTDPFSNVFKQSQTIGTYGEKLTTADIYLDSSLPQHLNVQTFQNDAVQNSISASLSSNIDDQPIESSNELISIAHKIQHFCSRHLIYLHSAMSKSEYAPLVYVEKETEQQTASEVGNVISASSVLSIINTDKAFGNIFNDVKHFYRNFTVKIIKQPRIL